MQLQLLEILRRIECFPEKSSFEFEERVIWPAVRYCLWMALSKRTTGVPDFEDFQPFNIELNHDDRQRYVQEDGYHDIHSVGHFIRHQYPLLRGQKRTLFATPANPTGLVPTGIVRRSFKDPILDSLIGKSENNEQPIKIILLGRPRNKPKSIKSFHLPAIIAVPDPDLGPGTLGPLDQVIVNSATYFRQQLDFDPTHILRQNLLRYLKLTANWKVLLKGTAPEKILFQVLGQHMALADAARQLAIKTTDIQHGVIRGMSPIYNFWQDVPKNGWHGLPDEIQCWTSEDAAHIRQVFNNSVLPRVLRRDKPKHSRIKQASLRLKLKIFSEQKVGIITLQEQQNFPALFEDLMASNPGLVWIIKEHPKWSSKIDYSHLNGRNIRLIKGGRNSLSFDELCAICDYHFTRDSAATYEALLHQIPSYVYGSSGRLAFAAEIESGTVQYLDPFSLPKL